MGISLQVTVIGRPGDWAGMLIAFAWALVLPTLADAQDTNQQKSNESRGLKENFNWPLSDPIVEKWEMGIEVTAGNGGSSGLVATFPVPMDWPEQKILNQTENKEGAINRMTYKVIDHGAKQATVTISRLAAGESARATVVLEIEKRMILPFEGSKELQFADSRARARLKSFLQPSPYIESNDPKVLEIARQLKDDSLTNWEQVEAIYDWVRANVAYKFDPEIRSPLTALEKQEGDCEELSSLFIAICRAQGIPARAVWIPDHTYPEFWMTDGDGNGVWIPCQAAGDKQFGQMQEEKPILQKGDSFRTAGSTEPTRYLQPTLTAKDAKAPPQLRWIIRRLDGAESK